jgi:Domain of unknown function (DUF4321)
VRNRQKDLKVLVLLLILGMIMGSAVGEAIGHLAKPPPPPEKSVVRDFFLESVEWGFGPTPISLVVVTLTIGLTFKVNVMAVLGIVFAAYLFRWY